MIDSKTLPLRSDVEGYKREDYKEILSLINSFCLFNNEQEIDLARCLYRLMVFPSAENYFFDRYSNSNELADIISKIHSYSFTYSVNESEFTFSLYCAGL